jgi:hypothetical protein
MNVIDNPYLSPPGTYPPASVSWVYNSTVVPAGFAQWEVPPQPGTPLGLLIPIVWSVANLFFRVETPGTTPTTIQFQRYTGTGAFSVTNILNALPVVIPPGANESTGQPYTLATFDSPLVNSFDKIRPAISLGVGASNVSFRLTFVQVPGM